MAEVVLKGVSKAYAGRPTVHAVDLTVADKEFMVLVGPSGCGKSTTLRMIAGLEDITSGRLLIDGADVTHAQPQKRDIAMVFQSYALYPHMTAYRNMAFGLLKTTNLGKVEVDRRIREAAEILHITHLLDRKPNQLSGGERQRVAIGRALVRQPKVFLFDEPLSNLDAKLRTRMRGELKRLHKELGLTVIYVTHDQIEAMTLGTRVAILSEGRLQQVGPPMELYMRPANTFVATFIGTPEMSLLRCAVTPDGEGSLLQHERFTTTLAARPGAADVFLGVRPEEIRLTRPAEGMTRGIVERTELIGSEALAEILIGQDRIVARMPVSEAPESGAEVSLSFDLTRARLFDATSGRALAAI
ncbi:ABC transporter ATP-binding protein [Bosea sp. BH3]|uniref:ABC transporter ATP-binding protein n=1 Tax=Bosea sp. BH3 TaxID=2871701 RepID=UPI0021CB3B34|nr:ABC transporter ATP-binding protein [Bosea sp. BH3]MCU4179875.1 ABC transporter ATP-binding protein [Bosea sp. BH3]